VRPFRHFGAALLQPYNVKHMPDSTKPWPLCLLVTALALGILIPNAFAGQACYTISNFAVPNYVNITLNSTKFMMRLNYIGPNSAGITINESRSYNLLLNQSQTIMETGNYTYSSELINVSWLPVEHTVVVTLCSEPNQSMASTTTTSIPASTTSTMPQSNPYSSNPYVAQPGQVPAVELVNDSTGAVVWGPAPSGVFMPSIPNTRTVMIPPNAPTTTARATTAATTTVPLQVPDNQNGNGVILTAAAAIIIVLILAGALLAKRRRR